MGEFLAKKVEMETPNRTYYHRSTCCAFIPEIGDVAVCVRCRTTMYVTLHRNSIAVQSWGQRCYSCRWLIELRHGCILTQANVVVNRDVDVQGLTVWDR